MKNLFICTLVAIATFTLSQSKASEFEREGRYIYHTSPWTEFAHDEATVEYIYKASFTMLQNEIQDLHDTGAIPEKLESLKDMLDQRKAEKVMDQAVATLNEWMAEQRNEGDADVDALLPKAFMVFAGSKASFNFTVGGGGQLILGLVIMPVIVQKYDIIENENVGEPYLAIRTAPVFWFGPELGFGMGGGAGYRIGAGLIWSDVMTDPDQFYGWGAGASINVELLAGANIKAGFVSNKELKDWFDFTYVTAAVNIGGARVAAELHGNVVTILPISKIFEVFEATGEKSMRQVEKNLGKTADSYYKIKPPPKKKPVRKPPVKKKPTKKPADDDDTEHDGIGDGDIETGPFDYDDKKK